MLLERAHPKSTSTDVALSLFGSDSIEVEIDYRKLVFLGQLSRLSGDHGVKQVFMHRLLHYNESPAKKLGFFPDIFIVYLINMRLRIFFLVIKKVAPSCLKCRRKN